MARSRGGSRVAIRVSARGSTVGEAASRRTMRSNCLPDVVSGGRGSSSGGRRRSSFGGGLFFGRRGVAALFAVALRSGYHHLQSMSSDPKPYSVIIFSNENNEYLQNVQSLSPFYATINICCCGFRSYFTLII
ncbi:hypothetical protein MSG28_003634 [Choristoneura fumiferana]|uniref:Uncharacterized protein n=1 Tax=Choristoneura fumiferana TaxID=7141 RepID=A0ACC0KFN6_CHOFU|nr:hypothetical protein MSG28_003634 [Choristoneura fumiferana]